MKRLIIAETLVYTAPFALAGLVFVLFTRADRVASSAANKAISAWLRGEAAKNLDVTSGVLAIFDAIYSKRLFSIEALVRSALISLLVAVVVVPMA
jgi:hypothetical protein